MERRVSSVTFEAGIDLCAPCRADDGRQSVGVCGHGSVLPMC